MSRTVLGLTLTALLGVGIVLALAGCGGHSAQAPAPPGGGGGGGTTGASFVGQDTCEGCHTDVAAEYATQAHGGVKYGGDFRNKSVSSSRPQGVVTPGGSCNPCHVVGYEEPSGFNIDGSTPHLEGIGCEECHGPGSNHAAAPSSANIIHEPDAKETCYDCHVQGYKLLDGPVPVMTAADLTGRAPASVSVHHPQATYLEGKAGYEMPDMPSPHTLVQNQCIGCHLNPNPSSESFDAAASNGLDHGAEGLHPDPITCAPCHGGEAGAVALAEHFEHEVHEALLDLVGEDPENPGMPNTGPPYGGAVGAFIAAHSIDPEDNSNPDDPNVQALKGALYIFSYIEHDSSGGIHNPPFTEAMLDKAFDLVSP